ncbi:carboxypeptidase M32 [Kamptonema sp. UHCC 0994]|uniref:carboxypeptidase M32 n=1 Tax=Kamptonema sp. UHCC 0994 TaxID=3031329 RepID=UPI0023BAADE2|nr:carboxypeptidase M32 [Kamptonema sp. UHCC 0994]MDF0556496.1 carboxypeptidase M32 [Kamptonema sp. UHCC 0994]
MHALDQTEAKFALLKTRLSEISDIESAAAVLHWDQATYMPVGGANARGRQLATLKQISHEKFIDPAIGQLLEDLRPCEASLPYDSTAASLIRIARKDYDRAARVPSEFMAKFSRHQAACYEAWAKAKAENNFAAVEPYLEKTLELSQEYSDFFPDNEHIADPLIDLSDCGMTVAKLRPLFAELRQELVPIVDAIASQPPTDDSCLHQDFPESQQLEFCRTIIERIGFDFKRGRQDKSLHPFMTNFSIDDVRITARIYENNIAQALFSTIHEMGHALYELGNSPEFESTPLAGGISSGVHESQSRLWENLVGHSRGFWECFYPQLQGVFLRQLGQVSINTFYRAINKVERSLIRTDADEVTYNLHVMIRFDLELALLEGKIAVRDLPEAWNERYRSDLGLVPTSDSIGVMQDVHWYVATIGGMFQGYALGNLIGAQFYEAAVKFDPEIPVEIEQGNFSLLHNWLKENIYQHGRKYTAAELMERVTGSPLTIEPFIRYIRQKYGDFYSL